MATLFFSKKLIRHSDTHGQWPPCFFSKNVRHFLKMPRLKINLHYYNMWCVFVNFLSATFSLKNCEICKLFYYIKSMTGYFIFIEGEGSPLLFLQHNTCSAPGSLWEMPDSNPGPLPQKSVPMQLLYSGRRKYSTVYPFFLKIGNF